ncbi:DUF2058 family protein [Novilysobacter erysipheiresistens]|uniref:DUF2058 family protein n=1 Tax=Novilysobacter erysipheiresistens TaxID=1749332 RepID=A0ABU7Z0Q3_9GAMM
MSNDTLRNQLLGLGFKPPAPEPKRADGAKRGGRPGAGSPDRRGERGKPRAEQARPGQSRPAGKHGAGKPGAPRPGRGRANPREDIDLAKAYAIRSQREKDERIEAERVKQEEARLRREARARLAELLKDKGLNVAEADIARHFPYGGKIKRIHVTADQLKALNAGELGVVQVDGRYLLVTAEVLAQAEQVFAPAVALKVDPDAPVADDPYSDPQYQVPDDLVW